jgi:DNA-directed RNA polymerase subunit M/transcription elongation factor TFIIS
MDKGKLRKTTNKKCPDCGKPLEIRQFGSVEKITCSKCEYTEEDVQKQRFRKKEDDE